MESVVLLTISKAMLISIMAGPGSLKYQNLSSTEVFPVECTSIVICSETSLEGMNAVIEFQDAKYGMVRYGSVDDGFLHSAPDHDHVDGWPELCIFLRPLGNSGKAS
jgi:hypothetical protein